MIPNTVVILRRKPLLLAILLAGFALRLFRLGIDSLWYDETVSAFLASESIPDLIAHTARDIHPPGYYLLLHLWTLAAGHTEFALAFFSVIFGLLIIPLAYRLARLLANPSVAIWTALLVAVSPYHLWYSQEVRMYTLGAVLGLITVYCFWQLVCRFPSPQKIALFWLGYTISATLGLYTLYYFAFLLVATNFLFPLFLAPFVIPSQSLKTVSLRERIITRNNFPLFSANFLIFLAYLPWLPTAWRQITYPPVPSWRTFDHLALWPAMRESWSALLLGQSVEPQTVWPILLVGVALFYLGFHYLNGLANSSFFPSRFDSFIALPTLFLLTYTFGPLLLILILSARTPLYHVRYLFTYSPAFYIILAAGLAWLTTRRWLWTAVAASILLVLASLFSIYQYHFDPRYQADDYRTAVRFIEAHWQPGDIILVNAGYVYTAYLYYTHWPNLQRQRLVPYRPPGRSLLLQTGSVDGSLQLGWGDPRSDFYAMSAADTSAALEKLSHDFSRLWLLRAYDTVTDPTGLIRAWLAQHSIPLEDQPFAGESNIRAQGFLLPGANVLPPDSQTVRFEDGLVLAGWSLPEQAWSASEAIPVKLWWRTDSRPGVDYKMSLKLWNASAQLAAQGQDTWPAGTLYRATTWPIGQTVYQAEEIALPADLPPGPYWLNVELYHPETGLPLPRLDGADPVVTLASIRVEK